MDELKDILSNSNKDIDNQKLMDYLSGKLSAEEKHDVEKEMSGSDFMNDAIEGLEEIKNKKNLTFFVEQMNADLHKQLSKKKTRKLKRKLKDQPWLYFAIVLILLIIIICFVIIKKHLDNEKTIPKQIIKTEKLSS